MITATLLFFCTLIISCSTQADSFPGVMIDDGQYTNAAAAQALWIPMADSAPVLVKTIAEHTALCLPCNFAGTTSERASWDRAVKLDLETCGGIQFKFFCRDDSPVSYFSIYFQSGNGWYHGTFLPESSTAWNTITLNKIDMNTEGKPAGWNNITTIRISAWRSKNQNTEFFLRDLRKIDLLGEDVSVAVLRNDAGREQWPDEYRSVTQYSESMVQLLRSSAIGCAIVSDLKITAAQLQQVKLVVLPHNPHTPDRVSDELIQYVKAGGKILVCYSVPDKLRPLLQVEGGAHVKESYPGQFSSIRFANNSMPGAPPITGQQSWNINGLKSITPYGRVFAEWFDNKGQPTGYAAVLGSPQGLVLTHVLLSDDIIQKRRMLQAMVGYLVPKIWQQTAQMAIDQVGQISEFTTLSMATQQLTLMSGNNPKVIQALALANQLRDEAVKLVSQQHYAEALDQASAASQQVKLAYCRAQKPEKGEFRAFWCHSAFGVNGMEWDEAIKRLADQGFTDIIPNMLWGGSAFYASKVLPVVPQVAQRGDQIALCLAACRKYGIKINVWKVCWNLGDSAPKEFVERMKQEGRLQADANGKTEPWLCPSHPDNQKLEIEAMVEVARNYDVDGIHFDYIRYPDGDHCYCSGCKERFQKTLDRPIENWPKDTLLNGSLNQKWLDWRRSNITAVVRTVSARVRAFKPSLKISAAVFPRWNTDRDGVGQDWKLWCDQGYLDFVCPMDYTPSNRSFENMVTPQVEWAGHVPCYPGIGVSASSSSFGVDRTIEQISITRRHQTHGFVIFNYGVSESNDLLPMLGKGITSNVNTK
jgi:uncharacterized lipoprotein YddW (UPF0748 family)